MEGERADSPLYGPFFGIMGSSFAMLFSAAGAAYGTLRSASAIASLGPRHPQFVMRALVPVIMAGIIGIYGLVVALLLATRYGPADEYDLYHSFLHLGAGLSVGLCGVASGWAIGVSGNECVRSAAVQPKMFVAMILILIFAEVIGIYGFIVALLLLMKP